MSRFARIPLLLMLAVFAVITTVGAACAAASAGRSAASVFPRLHSEYVRMPDGVRLGLDQYQVRRYDAWYRHVTLCLVAGATSCSTTALDDRAGQPAPRSALPRAQPGPPARYRPPVFVVPRAEPALQLRLLQPVDPGDQRERDETR